MLNTRCWVAAHMCVLSHFRTCDVRAKMRAERVWNCACGSACVWANIKVRFAITLFYLFSQQFSLVLTCSHLKDAFNLFLHKYIYT